MGLTGNKEKAAIADCSYYRISISLIAGRLLFSRACFLLGLTVKIKKFFYNIIVNITER
jgi:hypothetical protein